MFARARFRKGINHLVLRGDNDIGPATFAAHICVSGEPRPGPAARERGHAGRLPKDTRGWRGQWNGQFPDASPPFAWDLGKGINIVWRTPIPVGNSAPVIAGDRVFTQAEPHGVICVDKNTGKLLWTRECNVLELTDPVLLNEYGELRRAHESAQSLVTALGSGRERQLVALQARGLTDTQAEQKLSQLEHDSYTKWRAWQGFFAEKGRLARAEDVEHRGYGMPTPATDGKHVWVKFGTGVAACFDLDGNRKWMVSLGDFASSQAMVSSPVLVGGRLITVAHIRGKSRSDAGMVWMKGLDPATGAGMWQTGVSGTGTPVPLRLAADGAQMDVVVSSGGTVVRCEDGKAVGRVASARFGGSGATPSGDILYYWSPERATAARLIMYDRDRVGARLLWDRHVLGQYGSPPPVQAGGNLFGYRRKGTDEAVEVVNALTGERVKSLGLVMWTTGAGSTIPLSAAGGYVFVADDGSSHNGKEPRTAPGSMSVIQPGVRGQIIARNRIEGMGGPPAFDGDRIYLRARDAMMCIGYTGDEGRGYEAQTVAAALADWIYPEKPVRGDALAIAPAPGKRGMGHTGGTSLPVADPRPWAARVIWHTPGPQYPTRSPVWVFAGPFPLRDRAEVLESLGDLAGFEAGLGTKVPRGGDKVFGDLGIRYARNRRTSYRLDLLGPLYGEADTASYYYTCVHNTDPHTYRLELDPGNVRLWIQGVPVKHQQRLRLAEGYYSMLMEVTVPEPAPEELWLSLQFWHSDNQDEELRHWQADVRDNQELLNRACAWAHGSDAARQAEAILRGVPGWQPPKVAYRVKARGPATAAVRGPVVPGEAKDTRVEWRDVELSLDNALDLRLRLRDGEWDPVARAENIRLEGRFGRHHAGNIEAEERGGKIRMTASTKLSVQGSEKGEPATFTIDLARANDGKLSGAYTGLFQGNEWKGNATGRIHPPWPGLVKNWEPVAPGEHPRLIFRKKDLPALRKRMETPEGKAIIAQMKKLLNGRFTNGHPAAYGFLYQVTGDPLYARKCRGMLDELLAGRCGVDGRYHFANPNGQLRAGPSIGVVAMAYDLGYETFDEAYRQRVANRLLNHKMTEEIVNRPRHGAGCNHYGAHQGGIGVAMLAIRGDPGVDHVKVEKWLRIVLDGGHKGGIKSELNRGFSRYGYYYEGHHCGRISKTGAFPFVHALRVAAGLDCTMEHTNTQWLLSRWVYEFIQIDGVCRNIQRGMYAGDPLPKGGGWSGDGDFAMGFGFTPAAHRGALLWAYNHLVEPDPVTRAYSAWRYPHLAGWAFVTWPMETKEQNPAEIFPNVHHDPDPGYFVFRNDWTGTESDVVVTALLGSKPRHGRGMAQGGSVEVLGMGLRARFPGAFFHDRMTYFKPEKDGSGVLSAEPLAGKVPVEVPQEKAEDGIEDALSAKMPSTETDGVGGAPPDKTKGRLEFLDAVRKHQREDRLTALAVDYSGRCGAPVLVAMTGRMLGKGIGTWMTRHDAGPSDVKGTTGAFTRTAGVRAGDRPYYVMTIQKGTPPAVRAQGDKVAVGDLALWFDGEKIVLGK